MYFMVFQAKRVLGYRGVGCPFYLDGSQDHLIRRIFVHGGVMKFGLQFYSLGDGSVFINQTFPLARPPLFVSSNLMIKGGIRGAKNNKAIKFQAL